MVFIFILTFTNGFRWGLEGMECFASIVYGFFTALLIFLCISAVFSWTAETEYVITSESNLYAFSNKSTVEGSFFLGSGYVSGDMNYYYISDFHEGKKMYRVGIDNVVLIESDAKPKIEIHESRFKNKVIRYIFVNINSDLYKIYIPENSITYEFDVDLNN